MECYCVGDGYAGTLYRHDFMDIHVDVEQLTTVFLGLCVFTILQLVNSLRSRHCATLYTYSWVTSLDLNALSQETSQCVVLCDWYMQTHLQVVI